ncbi:MAG: TetR/AcrR family transcriptional regulator [Cyanobacteria bacterium REEB67]|nr:TetR/AcrR family transcriptional regulator [Cyanobacteria bacterium REEB67]
MSAGVSTASPTKQDTRLLLLEAGINIMLEKGYNNTGISEILASVGVPKGSFYHFFESKEEYGLAIIAYTDEQYAAKMAKVFGDKSLTPIERLKKYCAESRKDLVANECRKGCLIGNLSQEMADQSECMRAALVNVLEKSRAAFAACIEEGQKKGEIDSKRPASELAELVQSTWTGAVLRVKTLKNTEPLDTCTRLIFEDILKA